MKTQTHVVIHQTSHTQNCTLAHVTCVEGKEKVHSKDASPQSKYLHIRNQVLQYKNYLHFHKSGILVKTKTFGLVNALKLLSSRPVCPASR